jgi:regulator of nucleoside diphosphate kinase
MAEGPIMPIVSFSDYTLSPDIVLGQDEHRTLLRLAMGGTGHTADDADELLYELERAMIVPGHTVPPDVVRMGSIVQYRSEDDVMTVQLVYPKDADIADGKISVLTPIGTALIGLRTGQSMTWRTRGNRRQALTVLKVMQPKPDDEGPLGAA